jgi:hypothetical protein
MANAKITLKANFQTGEGDIGNIEKFRSENYAMLRLDLVADWLDLLENEYEQARLDLGWEPRK